MLNVEGTVELAVVVVDESGADVEVVAGAETLVLVVDADGVWKWK